MLVSPEETEKEIDRLIEELSLEGAHENHELIQTIQILHGRLRALGKELTDSAERERYTYFVRVLGQRLFEVTGEFFPLRLEPLSMDPDAVLQEKNQESSRNKVTIESIKNTLIACRRSEDMDRVPAAGWSSVQMLVTQGASHANAINQVLELACKAIAQTHPNSIELITAHYIKGLSVSEITDTHHISRPTFYRRMEPGLQGLATWINDYNQATSNRAFPLFHWTQHALMPRLPMVGTELAISRIEKILFDPLGSAVVIITGMAGIGKTTLAQLIAQRASPPTFAGVLWASVKQVSFDTWFGLEKVLHNVPLSINNIVYQLAAQLEIKPNIEIQGLIHAIHAKTQHAPHLIVIDNLETLSDSPEFAALISLLAISNRIIITSRDYHPNMLPASLARGYFTLDELDLPTSIQLLRLAATYTATPQLENASDDDLTQIYSITGGNPLALWLVAAQAKEMPWRVFLDHLDKNYQHGLTGSALYNYIYRNSWDLLSNDAKTILFSMHRYTSGATYDDLFQSSGLEPSRFHQSLSEVLRQMLITFDGNVYRIHRLTHTFLRVLIAGWWS